jgi:hypothetical protein
VGASDPLTLDRADIRRERRDERRVELTQLFGTA